jgi:hypothetical protein
MADSKEFANGARNLGPGTVPTPRDLQRGMDIALPGASAGELSPDDAKSNYFSVASIVARPLEI